MCVFKQVFRAVCKGLCAVQSTVHAGIELAVTRSKRVKAFDKCAHSVIQCAGTILQLIDCIGQFIHRVAKLVGSLIEVEVGKVRSRGEEKRRDGAVRNIRFEGKGIEHQVVELIKAVGEQVADGFLHARHRKVAGNLRFGIRLHKTVLCRDVLEVFARQHSRRNGKERGIDGALLTVYGHFFAGVVRQLNGCDKVAALTLEFIGRNRLAVQRILDGNADRRLCAVLALIINIGFVRRPLERIAGLFRHHVALEVLDIGKAAFVGNGIKTVVAVQPIAGDLLLHGTVCVQDEIRGFFFLNGSIRRKGRGSAAEEEKCGNRSRNGFCKILTHIDRDPFSESIMPFSR